MQEESGNGDVSWQEENATTDADEASPLETEDQLEMGMLQSELADLRDRSARTLADFDNYRKRIERERREERRYGALGLAADVVDVVDNLERAMAADGGVEDLKVGVEMTLKQLEEILVRHHIHRVPAIGERFDPNVHNAVSQHPERSVAEPTVSAELQPGYKLHDRLVRPAMVVVAQPVPDGDSGDEDSES